MAQYYPAGQVGKNPKYEAINRKIEQEEFEDAGLARLVDFVRAALGA